MTNSLSANPVQIKYAILQVISRDITQTSIVVDMDTLSLEGIVEHRTYGARFQSQGTSLTALQDLEGKQLTLLNVTDKDTQDKIVSDYVKAGVAVLPILHPLARHAGTKKYGFNIRYSMCHKSTFEFVKCLMEDKLDDSSIDVNEYTIYLAKNNLTLSDILPSDKSINALSEQIAFDLAI